ncbi:ankyrin repeat-containing domain protein [Dactylonectria macrodidyma]|uniref:Ankyrin repeat-containing domain protein n=1 Tax=Dactylonectria macrodidyma TaxID=307937 RepID=A0A9P9DY49_9HYPO|nr:ankyrin repeat-containing domain protein [Dactylonectria macrodidyma]
MSISVSYYEEDVIRLYIQEGKSAEDTIKCLNEQHGTAFTVRQFKTKFNGLKNLSALEWQQIAREIHKREAQGLGSDVYFYGRRQDPERVKRALRRYGKEKEDLTSTGIDLSLRKHGRQRIEIRTPGAQDNTQQAGTGSSALPHATERLRTPQNLHIECFNDPLNGMFDCSFGMSVDDQNFDFNVEGIELGYRMLQLGELFDTNHYGSSNFPSLGHVEDLDISSLLPSHRDLQTAEVTMVELSDRPQQLALRQRGSSPFPAACHINTTHHLEESSQPLRVSPEITSHMFRVHTGNPLEAINPMLGLSWDQAHVRVPRGEPGWFASQLIGLDPAMANLVEKVLTNAQEGHELRYDGYNKESINYMFAAVTRLVLNKLISWEQLLNFMEWILEKNLVNELYEFLQKGTSSIRTFIAIVLNALSNEARELKSPSRRFRHERRTREDYFIMKHPLESTELIRAADKRTLSGSLGGRLLVHVALSKNLDAAKLLVSANSTIANYQDDVQTVASRFPHISHICMTPLCAAVYGNSIEILRCLIEKGADIDQRTRRNRNPTTALAEAVRMKNADMVKLLLDGRAKMFPDMEIDNESILKYAKRSCPAIRKQLQDSTESKLDSDIDICSLLLVDAAENGNNSLSEFLFQHSNVRHEALEPALWLAVKNNNVSAVRNLLLHRGADPNAIRYRRDKRAEHLNDIDQDSNSNANSLPNGEIFDSCRLAIRYGKGSDEYFDFTHPVYLAIASEGVDSVDILYLLIKAQATITIGALLHALQSAWQFDHSYDLRQKCLVMVRLGFHATVTGPVALQLCAENGSIQQCDLLLDTGVDINSYGIQGSALQAAAGRGHLALVQYLLGRDADVNLPAEPQNESETYTHNDSDYDRVTALQGAALGGYHQVVNCLIDAGAKVTASPADITDMTVLDAAAKGVYTRTRNGDDTDNHRTQTFRKLLAHRAQINRTDGGVCTVLHHLVLAGQLGCLELALKGNASTEARGLFGLVGAPGPRKELTPIQLAASLYNMDAVQLLLKYKADINAPASDSRPGFTALQAAIAGQQLYHWTSNRGKRIEGMIVFLLQHNAQVNAPASNNFGRTALQAATTLSDPSASIVILLLRNGADVNAPPANQGGITALQGAAISGDIHVAKMLLTYKANINAPAAPIEGRTAVEGAAEHERLDMIRLLLHRGAMPDMENGFSRAIEFAEKKHRYDIIELLREREEEYARFPMGCIGQPLCDLGGLSSGVVEEMPGDEEIGI